MQAIANSINTFSANNDATKANPAVKKSNSLGEPMGFQQFEQKLDRADTSKDDQLDTTEQENVMNSPITAEGQAQPVVSDTYLAQLKRMMGGQAGSPEKTAGDVALNAIEGKANPQSELKGQALLAALTQQAQLQGDQQKFGQHIVPAANQAAADSRLEAGKLEPEQVLQQLLANKKLDGNKSADLMPAIQQLMESGKLEGQMPALERLIAANQAHSQGLHASVTPSFQHLSASSTEQAAKMAAQQFHASVDISEPEWGRDLVEQLRSRIQFSKADHLQQAHVRLDPPELGKLDINLRMDGDKVSVHFTAAHPQLREALMANAERLRMDFDGSQLQLGDVSVSSGQQQGQHSRGSHGNEEEVIAANQTVITQAGNHHHKAQADASRFESVV
ncbi:hypothetical protein A3K86_09795 [Photobacterium jeanii]|uniref:Flagellar hook-length control protein-like C-terminal domain-containing protein n=1 Tax=Photobacterium jeanii TaxID=858640 RepID=A0A178KHE9_9GAMM|nr:flagellar hook-length control protein FliK [Photobacterium jeanii]OAN16728.1 hypothetical protein A3K86_09795 [Photobacterium jeanii]PST87458.1 flagellar hook-length control protein FliK [Photobacterium jeanii]